MNIYFFKKFAKNYFGYYSGLSTASWQIISLKFIVSLLISICYFLPIYFVNILNFSINISGFIISCYGVGTVFGGFIGGKMCDKISPILICIISLVLAGLAFICLMFISSWFLIVIDLFLLGAAAYSLITSAYILTLLVCQENESQRLKAISILETVSNLGLGLAALLIGFIHVSDIHYLFLIAGLIFILTSIYIILIFDNFNSVILTQKTQIRNSKFLINIKAASSHQLFVFILICLFIAGIIISQISSTYSLYLNQLFPAYHFGGFGIVFALNTLLVVFFQAMLTAYCAKFNYILTAGVGVLLLGLGMFLLVFSHSFYLVLLSCVIYTVGEMLFFSVSTLICYQNAAANKRGLALGIYRMIYASSRIAGPVTGSYIYSRFGSTFLWSCCGIIGMTCFIGSVYFKKTINLSN